MASSEKVEKQMDSIVTNFIDKSLFVHRVDVSSLFYRI